MDMTTLEKLSMVLMTGTIVSGGVSAIMFIEGKEGLKIAFPALVFSAILGLASCQMNKQINKEEKTPAAVSVIEKAQNLREESVKIKFTYTRS